MQNGVGMPKDFHRKMHTNEYFEKIAKMADKWKNKDDAIRDLKQVASDLLKSSGKQAE